MAKRKTDNAGKIPILRLTDAGAPREGAMTDRLNIIVAGGGITGVSTAEWLRRDGHDVTLIDRGRDSPVARHAYLERLNFSIR